MLRTLHRKKVGTAEKEKDFFQTDPRMVIALRESQLLKTIAGCYKYKEMSKQLSVLDPCAGEGVIRKYLPNKKLPFKVSKFDQFDKYIFGNNGVKEKDFLEDIFPAYDIAIFNAPYSNKRKYKFLTKSLSVANFTLALMPVSVESYNLFVRDWLASKYFFGKLHMYPKVILDTTTNPVFGGDSQYCWYCFTDNTQATIMVGQQLPEYVNLREIEVL